MGCFTIDPDRAVALLGRVRLPYPHFYVLKLVQAGVASGAPRVDVGVSWLGVSVAFKPPQPLPLENLFHHLLDDREAALHHLAVGVNSASKASVQQRGTRYSFGPKGVWQETCWPSESVRIQVNRFTLIPQEGELVQERCGWSPVPVWLNGRPVLPVQPPGLTVQHYVLGEGLLAPCHSSAALPPRIPAALLGRPVPCRAAIGLGPTGILLVKHGVLICRRPGPSGVWAILPVEGKTDLSGFAAEADLTLVEAELPALRQRASKMVAMP